MAELKRELDDVTHRAHMTTSKFLDAQEARSRAELTSFSWEEQHKLLKTHNDWLKQQVSSRGGCEGPAMDAS